MFSFFVLLTIKLIHQFNTEVHIHMNSLLGDIIIETQ